MHFVLDSKGNEHTVGNASLPSWKLAAFNLAMISSLTQGNAPLWPQGSAKKASPVLFVSILEFDLTEMLEAKGLACAFKQDPKTTDVTWSYFFFLFFFKANGDFSVSSPRSVLPVSVPATVKQQIKPAALLPREGTTRQLKKGMEASRLYLRHYIFMS